MRWPALALLASTACVPTQEVSPAWTAQSYLVVDLSSAWPHGGRVFAAEGELPDLVRAPSPEERLFLVGYDQPLEALALAVDDTGEVAVVDGRASLDEGWPLPTPARWSEVDTDATPAAAPGPLDPALTALRLAPPRCPSYETEVVARGYSSASATTRASDEVVLVGVEPEVDRINRRLSRPPLILAVTPDGVTLLPPPATLATSEAYAPTPLVFAVGDGVRVTWGSDRDNRPRGLTRSYALTATLGYADEIPFDLAELAAAWPQAIAGAEVDGALHMLASFDDSDNDGVPNHFVYAARGRTFTRIEVTAPALPPDDSCMVGVFTHIIELDADGRRGLVGLRNGPVRVVRLDGDRYVLGETYGPAGEARACRTTHTTLDTGEELFAWDVGPAEGARLAWRTGAEAPWQPLPSHQLVTASCAATDGDVAYLCAGAGSGGSVAVFTHDPRRPELPPRRCPDVLSQVRPRAIARTTRGLVVTGFDGVEWMRRLP